MFWQAKERGFTYRHHARLMQHAAKEPHDSLFSLRSNPKGLFQKQVARRQRRFGLNLAVRENRHSWLEILWKAFHNPFNYLISTLAIISFFTEDLGSALVMGSMVVFSISATFIQEFRSNRAAKKLASLVQNFVSVNRLTISPTNSEGDHSVRMEIPISHLVPGDIVQLSAGDLIPADIRILSAKHLAVSQAALTGESIPMEKSHEAETITAKTLPELRNICLMGSSVVCGSATAVVIHIGRETYFGSIAKSLIGVRPETSFDKGIKAFTHLMLKFMLVMVPLVFLINGLTKGNWSEAFLFAVAMAVGLTPEMLPMIVTGNLAKGAIAMMRKKVIVKRLHAIQNFGAMDVLCTDKTGTLTEDKLVFAGAYDPLGDEDNYVLERAYLNSYFQTGLKNFLDFALIQFVEEGKSSISHSEFRLLDEVPFDFIRKRMSVLVEDKNGKRFLLCKGAVEELLERCTTAYSRGETNILDSESQESYFNTAKLLNEKGHRIVAMAMKEVSKSECHLEDESELTLLGYISFLDPPTKRSAAKAVEALSQYGVTIKILTGDNERVTQKVAAEVGLDSTAVLLGNQIASMSDEELRQAVEYTTIFAKLTPDQKQRIVHALHAGGHVVGFMGDGINDAPALRTADVGISVSNAVDIAKESADIILLEKSLLVLEEGVVEGRKVFGNISKYIKMGASSNFGNAFSLLGASSFLPFLPMLPMQMLSQNLLYDFSQTGIPFDNVDKEYLKMPRKWEIGHIGKFMLFMGPVSSLFDYATFGLLWFYFGANTVGSQSLFQSGWFVEGLLSQTLIVHLIRTDKIAFLESRASRTLSITTLAVMAVGLYLPFSGFGKSIGLIPLPLSYFPCLVVILVSYCVLTQIVKTWLLRKLSY